MFFLMFMATRGAFVSLRLRREGIVRGSGVQFSSELL